MAWVIYLIGGVDGFLGMLVAGAIACLACAGMMALFIENGDIDKARWIVVRKLIILAVVFFMIFVVTPNSKTIAAMYLLPKISANKHVQKIPDKALRVLEKKLDAYLGSSDEKEEE